MTLRAAAAALVAACLACGARTARADAQTCVAENNDGADRRVEHHLLNAREAYRACVAEPNCPPMVVAECAEALEELKIAIPRLIVSVVDGEQHDVKGAALTIDGKPTPMVGEALEVDPGPHVLVASIGAVSAPIEILVTEHDLSRKVQIVLRDPQTAGKEKAPTTPPPPLLSPARRSLVPSYVLGGIGLAAAGSFGYFALSGRADKNDLDQCRPYCLHDDIRQVRTEYLVADISLGVSVLALAGAAAYYLFDPRPERQLHPGGGLSLGLAPIPRGAGLSLRLAE